MVSRWWVVAGLASACLCGAGPVAAQAITVSAEIAGVVRDARTHEPVVSARVDLMSQSGMAGPTQFTDTNGEFHFGYIKDGDYHLNVRKMGYQDTQEAISVVAGRSSNVQVDLRPTDSEKEAESEGEAGPPGKISAHELTIPGKAREAFAKGAGLMDKKDYPAAIAELQKAIQESPDYYEAYAKMGVALYMAGQAAEAREALQKSIDMSEGKYPDALFDMTDVLNDVGEYAEAEPLARKEIGTEESSWRGYFELARALLGLKRYSEAEQSAKKCIELDGQYKQGYVVLTNIHIELHRYPEVLHDIDAYLRLDSTSPASEQMRATRAQVAKAIEKQQSKPNHNHKPR